MPTATAHIVDRNLWDKYQLLKRDGILLSPTELNVQLAKEALEWCQNISDAEVEKSDYLYNIRTVARAGSIDSRLIGYAASIIPAYKRHLEGVVARKREAEARLLSNWVGEIGKRLEDIEVTVLAQRDFTSDYGTSTLVTMADDAGNRYKWWSSCGGLTVKVDFDNQISYDPTFVGQVRSADVGERVRIKGTVKKHESYKDTKETVLSRVDQYFPKVKKTKAKKAAQVQE